MHIYQWKQKEISSRLVNISSSKNAPAVAAYVLVCKAAGRGIESRPRRLQLDGAEWKTVKPVWLDSVAALRIPAGQNCSVAGACLVNVPRHPIIQAGFPAQNVLTYYHQRRM